MLLQFSCSNHKSIKDKVIFSMIASSDDTNAEYLKKFKDINILRVASIYGANGSGKSNFVDAIGFAKYLIVNSLANLPSTLLSQVPHKLSNAATPSEYEFQFIEENIRYAYGFSLKDYLVAEEYLYYFPNNRRVKIFERNGMNIIAGSRYKNSFKLSEDALKPNRLFLTCTANYTNIDEIAMAYKFFASDLILYRASINEPNFDNWYEYTIHLIKNNPEVKIACLEMLKLFDTGIIDISAKVEDVDVTELANVLPNPLKMLINSSVSANGTLKNFQVKLFYENFETDLMKEESTGIKQLFQILCPIVDILNNGRVLVYDEIETGLHEKIVHKLIELFYMLSPHKFAQLIFTTHDTSLLDMDLFRRDQIWFTQLAKERSTELYSLVELKNVRKNEKLSKGYINGKYGAIPMLNRALTQDINNYWEKPV